MCAQTVGKSGAPNAGCTPRGPPLPSVIQQGNHTTVRRLPSRDVLASFAPFLPIPLVFSPPAGEGCPSPAPPDIKAFPAFPPPFFSDIIRCIIPDTKSYPQLPQSFPQPFLSCAPMPFRNIHSFCQSRELEFPPFPNPHFI